MNKVKNRGSKLDSTTCFYLKLSSSEISVQLSEEQVKLPKMSLNCHVLLKEKKNSGPALPAAYQPGVLPVRLEYRRPVCPFALISSTYDAFRYVQTNSWKI